MAAVNAGSSTGPPKTTKKPTKSSQLRTKAELVLSSSKNANILCDILEMFNEESKNYTPVLLAVEMIFTTMLRRGDMCEHIVALKPQDKSPQAVHARWLRSNYDIAMSHAVGCMKRGEKSSRMQAMVTCFKLLVEEGLHPIEGGSEVVCFPARRLKNIFEVMLDRERSQTALINRLRDYTEYRDVQQSGLKMLSVLAYQKSPSDVYIQNYLEIFDALMKPGLPTGRRPDDKRRRPEDKYFCEKNDVVSTVFNPEICIRYINRCWNFCLNWPLRASETNHRRALVVLVDRILPYLKKPVLATDLLCDSLDCGSSISMIALRGMIELVTKHQIDYPDVYDRLYGMFEPEMFATRSKKRLIHLADVFLSSTRLPEALVAAFAKRFSRLALVAPTEDVCLLLELISNMIQRHPSLRRMLCHGQPAIMPKDPYVMEETSANASRAIHSSLWEISALQQHFTAEISAAAARLLASAGAARPPDLPPSASEKEQFEMEVKRRFKSIEMEFVRITPDYNLSGTDRLTRLWNMGVDF